MKLVMFVIVRVSSSLTAMNFTIYNFPTSNRNQNDTGGGIKSEATQVNSDSHL